MEKFNNKLKYFISWDKLKHPSPAMVELDLTNWCNANCSWCCAWRERQKPKQAMTLTVLVRELCLAAKNGYGVDLTGGGEPTLHPDWEEFVDLSVGMLDAGIIPSVNLVSNGILADKVRYFVERTKEPKSWVRLSINDRKITDKHIQLFKDFPGRIGLSLIYGNEKEKEGCERNKEILGQYAKFVRMKAATVYTEVHPTITPETCVGRFLHRLVESDGTIAFCCQSRGLEGKPLKECPKMCRWADYDLDKFWEMNPFS